MKKILMVLVSCFIAACQPEVTGTLNLSDMSNPTSNGKPVHMLASVMVDSCFDARTGKETPSLARADNLVKQFSGGAAVRIDCIKEDRFNTPMAAYQFKGVIDTLDDGKLPKGYPLVFEMYDGFAYMTLPNEVKDKISVSAYNWDYSNTKIRITLVNNNSPAKLAVLGIFSSHIWSNPLQEFVPVSVGRIKLTESTIMIPSEVSLMDLVRTGKILMFQLNSYERNTDVSET